MTLVIFIILFLALGGSTYLFLLNPQDFTLHLTRQLTIDISPVTLMLCSIALGVTLILVLSGFGTLSLFFRGRLEKSRERTFKKSEELFSRGFHRYYNGNMAAAEKLFRSVLSYVPSHIKTLYHLGNIKSNNGDYIEATRYHSRVRSIDGGNIENLYALAKDLDDMGDKAQAVAIYKDIFELDKTSVRPYEMVREIHVKSKEWDKAVEFQRKVVALTVDKEKNSRENDRISWFKYRLALEKISGGDCDEGVNLLKGILKLNVQFIPAYLKLVETYFVREREKDGIQVLQNGYKHTGAAVFILKLVEHYQGAGDDLAAVRAYRSGISVSKDPALLHLLLGDFFVRKGMAEEGVEELSLARGNFNGEALFHLILVKAYKALERYQDVDNEISLAYVAGTRDIILYECSFCHHKEREWMDTCPRCGEFNAFALDQEYRKVRQLASDGRKND